MGALVNELRCSRCRVGAGMGDDYLPHSWALASVTDLDSTWSGYLCEACKSEFQVWAHPYENR